MYVVQLAVMPVLYYFSYRRLCGHASCATYRITSEVPYSIVNIGASVYMSVVQLIDMPVMLPMLMFI
jgi:hypothetical protein